jgi:hypothetical protein
MDNFISKLKKGTGKYKRMLPLKCFNCGGTSHFAYKCPHSNKYSDEEYYYKRKRKYRKGNKKRRKRKFLKKTFYSKKDSSSLDKEDNDNDNDSKRVLFMVVEYDSKE